MIDQGFILLTIVDGHGPFGHQVANYAYTMLPKQTIQYPDFKNNPKNALK